MDKSFLKSWPTNYQEAVALQEELRQQVRLEPLPRPPRLVAGVDAICNRADTVIFGAVAVYRYPELELVEEAGVAGECPFPYRTGLLEFSGGAHFSRGAGAAQGAAGRGPGGRPGACPPPGSGAGHPSGAGGGYSDDRRG